MHRSCGIALAAALAIGLLACTESREDLSTSLKQTANFEQAAHIAAKVRRLVTGLDVGYDEQFIASYDEEDEPARQQMLDRWRRWVAEPAPTGEK